MYNDILCKNTKCLKYNIYYALIVSISHIAYPPCASDHEGLADETKTIFDRSAYLQTHSIACIQHCEGRVSGRLAGEYKRAALAAHSHFHPSCDRDRKTALRLLDGALRLLDDMARPR